MDRYIVSGHIVKLLFGAFFLGFFALILGYNTGTLVGR